MENNNQKTEFGTTIEEEVQMRKVAPMRVAFRVHLTIFVLVNLIMWVLWSTLFKGSVVTINEVNISAAIFKIFICVTVVWLIIVVFHYLISFVWNKTLIEKELVKMRKQRTKQLIEIQKLKDSAQKADN